MIALVEVRDIAFALGRASEEPDTRHRAALED